MRVINLDDGADLHANVKTIIPETTDIPEPVIVGWGLWGGGDRE